MRRCWPYRYDAGNAVLMEAWPFRHSGTCGDQVTGAAVAMARVASARRAGMNALTPGPAAR